MPPRKTALITGANGYIGKAVAQSFTTAGYKTYGLIRHSSYATTLSSSEITPIIGSASDLTFLDSLYTHSRTFDIVICASEDNSAYQAHFDQTTILLNKIAKTSNTYGVRPLVIFTSGCKDYGTTAQHGSTWLQPHTETSPLAPSLFLRPRAENAPRIFNHADSFDAVVTRPTTLYGLGSSYYAVLFAVAAAASEGGVLTFPVDERNIMHATHIADVGAAYLAIAEAPRDVVKGNAYNISSHRYETAREVGEALMREYGGIREVRFTDGGVWTEGGEGLGDLLTIVTGFSQWVSSERLRADTGWTDVRALFSEDIGVYRRAFEGAVAEGDEAVRRILSYAGFK